MKEKATEIEALEPILEPIIEEIPESGDSSLTSVTDLAESTKSMVPKIEVPPECKPLIEDKQLTDLYDEILTNSRDDRKEVSDLIDNLKDMVINDGDSTSATKEALVNLIKIKADNTDKLTKIADLWNRSRGVNTMPRWLAAQQNNTFNIGNQPKKVLSMEEKRALIQRESDKVE